MNAAAFERRLLDVLADIPKRIVACSGGLDSLVLAAIAATQLPHTTVIAHSLSPAVPVADTDRVLEAARDRGWNLRTVTSGEFQDERYLQNPTDRCYFCKSHLYDTLQALVVGLNDNDAGSVILSGANLNDLGEFRPGLTAAAEHEVRHPFIEAGLGKVEIRALARDLQPSWVDLPASPCLASRLYTGTRVTSQRLAAVQAGETVLRERALLTIARCRVRADRVLVEVADSQRDRVSPALLAEVLAAMRGYEPELAGIELDDQPYAPGRSFVQIEKLSVP